MGLGATLWGTWYALSSFNCIPQGGAAPFPPVSILKPIKGWDAGLEENLIRFFNLDYPVYELLLCLDSPNDPARKLIENLLERFPQVQARLMITEEQIGKNPKINNLFRAYEKAQFNTILISDSNVRVEKDYLKQAVLHLKPDVGIVTAVVAGTYSTQWGGHLESSYLNTFYVRWMQVSRAFGMPTVVGKSMLFRRSTLERIGGIRNLSCYIAEDYMAGRAMLHLGLKVAVSHQPIQQYIGKYSLKDFWQRHLRWGRIRKSHAPIAFVFEPLFMTLFSAMLGALGWNRLLGISYLFTFTLHILTWFIADLLLMKKVDRLRPTILLSWWIREVIALPHWIHMACGSSVNWRGKRLHLRSGGFLGHLSEAT